MVHETGVRRIFLDAIRPWDPDDTYLRGNYTSNKPDWAQVKSACWQLGELCSLFRKRVAVVDLDLRSARIHARPMAVATPHSWIKTFNWFSTMDRHVCGGDLVANVRKSCIGLYGY